MPELLNINHAAVEGCSPADLAAFQAAERKASAEREKRVRAAEAKRNRATQRAYAAIKRAEQVYRAECQAAAEAWHQSAEAFFPPTAR